MDESTPSPLDQAAQRNENLDAALRPGDFSEFTGQPRTIERLQVMTGAAQQARGRAQARAPQRPARTGQNDPGPHRGPHEMEAQLRLTSGPVVERPGDLAGILTNLEQGDVLFIDEIHRLPKTVEEYLYSAMEDFRIDIMLDQGPNARSVRLDIPRFTLVGATTRMGLLTAPLRSRFTMQTRLDYYGRNQLVSIVKRSCQLLDVPIDEDGAAEIAGRCRGTPRLANNLIAFVRDYAEQRYDGRITRRAAAAALELLSIDQYGLDEMDLRCLRVIAENYGGGPVGLGTIAVAVGEEAHTLEEVHEPYLIQEGYLQRTAQGRVLTPRGFSVLGLKPSPKSQQLSFDD
jgi:Holliday junction DNA helicase RuvB